jgi:hypothetical protein
MGILDPILADDINQLADDLLRRLDLDPQEMFMHMMMGSASRDASEPQVIVDGIPYY